MEEFGLSQEDPKSTAFKKQAAPGLLVASPEGKGGPGLGGLGLALGSFELESGGSLKIPKLNDKFLKYFEKKNLCE